MKACLILFFFFSSSYALSKNQKNLPQTIKINPIKPFPIIYNNETYRWIHFFVKNKKPNYIKIWLKRSYRYFPMMKRILREKSLPEELVYMTLIESSLSPTAVSSAKAVGYWQFIKPTASQHGLRVNHWLDERKDFEKSTLAATNYLSKLYKEFDDWLLTMAAYNMGENRLAKLIKKHKSRNFWILAKKHDFPSETALYVPKILAATLIMKNPERYGFSQFSILFPYRYDVFYAPGGLNLKQLCQETSLSFSELKTLNPELKKSLIPKTIYHHRIRIPKGTGFKISQWLEKQNL